MAYAKGRIVSLAEHLIPSCKDRQDTEHEQAIIRLLVGLVAAGYLTIFLPFISSGYTYLVPTIVIIIVFFSGSLILITWLIANPKVSKARRICGCFLDIGSASAAMWVNGDLATPLTVVYLWVTFGNGFRFGRKYLLFSATLSVGAFLAVILLSRQWETSIYVTIGLLIGLIALPAYVYSLLHQLESALEKSNIANEAKSNFLATMSHEIRTPLNGLIGILDLLKNTGLDSRQRHYVSLLDTSSEWLLQVISDGLDYTKIEADELIIDERPVDFLDMLHKISTVFAENASNKKILFITDIDADVPQYLNCDQHHLTQVLNNLISNALKFTEKGSVRLQVQCKKTEADYAEIDFQVEDTGIGIGHDQLSDIFLPFHQAKNTYTGGTGLGLAIAYNLVALMGGKLQVKSKVNTGTAFYFSLDLKTCQREEVESRASKQKSIKWNRAPEILLAEDNEINREVAVHILNKQGCNVTAVENGLAAVQKATMHSFDIVLMDCQMPILDGYQATRQILEENDATNNLPIVALTAFTTVQDRQKCLDTGMVDYVGKPYNEENLRVLLTKWLKHLMNEEYESDEEIVEDLPISEPLRNTDHVEHRAYIHQLRNHLAAVLGAAELAEEYQHDPEELQRLLASLLKSLDGAINISSKI